jgi:hypothetical protein
MSDDKNNGFLAIGFIGVCAVIITVLFLWGSGHTPAQSCSCNDCDCVGPQPDFWRAVR